MIKLTKIQEHRAKRGAFLYSQDQFLIVTHENSKIVHIVRSGYWRIEPEYFHGAFFSSDRKKGLSDG